MVKINVYFLVKINIVSVCNLSYCSSLILGSLWGENWVALSDLLLPYPKHTLTNITSSFLSKSYRVPDILRKAEQFYTTMGFHTFKQNFWDNSMFVNPKDRLVDCHSVSYDFALNEDFR